MRVIFMGTPDFSVPALQSIIQAGHDVVAVYTQPPRPKGRGQALQKSPVHLCAEKHNIPVYTPVSFKKDPDALKQFLQHQTDIAVVAAYGLILPKAVLEHPRFGCLNIHASILPRWRGASPIQRAIWAGDSETGITIMQMDEGLDTGGMMLIEKTPITEKTTAQSLHDELSIMGGKMIVQVLSDIQQYESVSSQPQDNQHSNYAALLKKEDGKIDWQQPAAAIDRQVRALTPWPSTWTNGMGKRFKIITGHVENNYNGPYYAAGMVLDNTGCVQCGDNTVYKIEQIQPDGSKTMQMRDAINGHYCRVHERFE